MKRRKKWLAGFLAMVFLVACSKQPQEESKGLKIVTSFYPIYAMTKEVSGDVNDVRMIQSSSGIHSFEPSPADVQAIYDADVFFYHSRILESWAGRLTPAEQGSKVKLVEASKGVEMARVEGLEDMEVAADVDEASLYDPHTWMDPILIAQEVEQIAKDLSAIDPENAATYQKNAEKMAKEAHDLADRYQTIFQQTKNKTFVTQHTAFAYTARRFGLTQLGIAGVSEEEPSPRQLAEIKEFIDTYHVQTIFVERGVSDKLAKALATSTDVELMVLEPLESDPQNEKSFLENLEANLAILAKELDK